MADITNLLKRNKRVEADKAWETSYTRKGIIIGITYIMATLLLWMIGAKQPFLGALVPCLGFFLSTLSIDYAKKYWLKHIYKPNE